MSNAVSGNAAARPVTLSPSHGGQAAQPSAEDVHAMGQALAAARARPHGDAAMLQTPAKGRQQGQSLAQENAGKAGGKANAKSADGEARIAGRAASEADSDPLVRERSAAREEAHGDALALAGQPLPSAPQAAAANPPAPHVDASAFAQLMTQLWLREKDKGSKEIRVEFGDGSWPATGAHLVRNAAGTLDIQLFVSQPQAGSYERQLEGLRERFEDNGVAIGALEVRGDSA